MKLGQTIFYQRLCNADVNALSSGNFSGGSNRTVIKKMASKSTSDAILHQNMITELELLRDTFVTADNSSREVRLIQYLLVTPFTVHLYSEEQLLILYEVLKSPLPSLSSLYFDATGSVVCNIPGQDKSVYYYPLLVNGNKHGCPPLQVAEMLSHGNINTNSELLNAHIERLSLSESKLSTSEKN